MDSILQKNSCIALKHEVENHYVRAKENRTRLANFQKRS